MGEVGIMNHKVILYIIVSLFVLMISWEHQQFDAKANYHDTVSQEEAIRLRILANSDSIKDQWLKREIRNEVNKIVSEWVEDIQNLEEARAIIAAKLPEIEKKVAQIIEQSGMNQSYQVEFKKVAFPTKLYGNLVYPAGEYEAILITLGKGQGENWWCVLFPPLCFVDFDHSDVAVDEEMEDQEIEVSFFLAEVYTKVKDWVAKS